MTDNRREVVLAPKALQQMVENHPSDEESEAIRNVLTELASNQRMGFEISFLTPQTYRIDVGRFRVHYQFNAQQIQVGFIGIY